MDAKQLLGLDVGLARTGVARASAVARQAEPLMTIETSKALGTLAELIEKQSIGIIVVGLPRNLQGEDTDQTRWVRKWVKEAKAAVEVPFYWQDEALTTVIARAGAVAHKKPRDVDALAAAIILQDFLDTPEAERVIC
ncbi:Holliday junction resolvase RuvX [Candidatus Saccharibacteria bacterium]|nr:Holliday junction resolvase RuvX [Candidatus Saccharibacteria bacterium]